MTVAFLITGLSFRTSKDIDFFLLFALVLDLTSIIFFVTKYLHRETEGSCVVVVLRGWVNIAGHCTEVNGDTFGVQAHKMLISI